MHPNCPRGTGEGWGSLPEHCYTIGPDMARQQPLDRPHGLDGRGLTLWRKVLSEFELDAAELAVLGQAARTLTLIDQLDAEVDAAGPVDDEGRPHRALAEVRQLRLTLGRLLGQLDLEDDGVMSPTQARARKAAAARWGHRDELERRRAAGRGA